MYVCPRLAGVFYLARPLSLGQGGEVGRWEGGKVGRWEGGKLGRWYIPPSHLRTFPPLTFPPLTSIALRCVPTSIRVFVALKTCMILCTCVCTILYRSWHNIYTYYERNNVSFEGVRLELTPPWPPSRVKGGCELPAKSRFHGIRQIRGIRGIRGVILTGCGHESPGPRYQLC